MRKSFCSAWGGVVLGDRVTLSYGCVVLTSGLDVQNYESWYQSAKRPHRNKSVVIEDGAWIGANAMIMPGCRISRNVVVGAGSIVTKNLDQEGWLYAGNPAKPIKSFL